MVDYHGNASDRGQDVVTVVLVTLTVVLITIFDIFFYPQHNVTILYTIPVLIGALRASPRAVVIIAVLSIGVDAVNAFVHDHPFEAWFLRTIVLVVVDGFAVLISSQRRALRERTRALEIANAHLRELEQQRAEWTSLIAHDLRQPVTVITGYASLLTKQAERQMPELARSAGHILASARQLNRLVGDLLDVSRIAAHRFTVEKRLTKLPELVQAVVERSAETVPEHPIRLEIHGEIPTLDVDPDRIEQVLNNLVSNAEKYSSPRSDIRVELARRDGRVEISVSNQGPGIPREELPNLFTRFYRTEEARAGPIRGTGLGLYISKGIVDAHGGTIWAESIPGQTTTFHVTLPIPEASNCSKVLPASRS